MTTLREAAQQALEALEHIEHHYISLPKAGNKAITALRAALAQPEPRNQCGETCERAKLCAVCARGLAQQEQEPVAWTDRELELIDGMIEVQLRHAAQCDAIANRPMAERQKGWDMERVALLRKIKSISPRRETEQEPVVWSPALTYPNYEKERVWLNGKPRQEDVEYWSKNGNGITYGYTAPPRREWQSLTDENIALIDWEKLRTRKDAVRAIEAKLKEKNA